MAISNGLYKVEFRTPVGAGAGVVVLQDGNLNGGDSGYYYVGTYQENGDKFAAKIKVGQHSTGIESVFGPLTAVNLVLEGQSTLNSVITKGRANEAPALTFDALLQKITN